MYNEEDEKYRFIEAIVFFALGLIGLFALVIWASL
jgi:hypothetical protein